MSAATSLFVLQPYDEALRDARRAVRAVVICEAILCVLLLLVFLVTLPALNDDWLLLLFQAGHVLSLVLAFFTLTTRRPAWPTVHLVLALLMILADLASLAWRCADGRLCGRDACPSRWLAVLFALVLIIALVGIDFLYTYTLLALRAVLASYAVEAGSAPAAVTYERVTFGGAAGRAGGERDAGGVSRRQGFAFG